MARMGTVIYLLALAVAPLTGWRVETTIVVTGALMTFYTLVGGIKAVVWTGVLQSAVLVAGTLLCLAAIVLQTPGGMAKSVDAGVADDKFSLGSFGPSLTQPTFWVVFLFGLFTHLTNFGIDQSYVQRYITARDDREAAKSIWITAMLYMPVAAIFFFIGTGLFVFYELRPELLGDVTAADKVFPHFIATQLPLGAPGWSWRRSSRRRWTRISTAWRRSRSATSISATSGRSRASGSRCWCCTSPRSSGAWPASASRLQ